MLEVPGGGIVKLSLLRILRCPDCGGHFSVKRSSQISGDIAEGFLNCKKCGNEFPIVRSIPRFVSSDEYSRSFSFQWNIFTQTQLDSEQNTQTRDTFVEKTRVDPQSLRGKIVLEAGCGMGRFLELVSRRSNATVVGFDLSLAVEAANRNVGFRPNVHVLQADIMHLPFAKSAFNFIFSIGVLHHTPNPKRAFASLVPLLKRRGEIAIWVYSKYHHPPLSDFYRMFTSRMPWSMSLALCRLFVKLYPVHKKLRYFKLILPISMLDDPTRRLLDTYDWYSPKYQFKFTSAEVTPWFDEMNLHNIRVLPFSVSVKGERT